MPVKDLVEGFKGEKIPKSIAEIASGLPYRDNSKYTKSKQ